MQYTVNQASPITPEIVITAEIEFVKPHRRHVLGPVLNCLLYDGMDFESGTPVDEFDQEKQLSREKVLIRNGCLLVVSLRTHNAIMTQW